MSDCVLCDAGVPLTRYRSYYVDIPHEGGYIPVSVRARSPSELDSLLLTLQTTARQENKRLVLDKGEFSLVDDSADS